MKKQQESIVCQSQSLVTVFLTCCCCSDTETSSFYFGDQTSVARTCCQSTSSKCHCGDPGLQQSMRTDYWGALTCGVIGSLIYGHIVSAAPVHNSSDLSLPWPLTEAKGQPCFFFLFSFPIVRSNIQLRGLCPSLRGLHSQSTM